MQDRIDPILEKKIRGRGGIRLGAGRSKGTKKEEKARLYLPLEVGKWLKISGNLDKVKWLMKHELPESESRPQKEAR